MKHHFSRGVFIALTTFLLGSSVYYLTSLETTLGLDALFKVRGARTPPSEVVVVAMDEASETRLGVGQDLTRWRSFHARLVQQLHRQGAALVVFDLQFIKSYLGHDQVLASAMQAAGNVLITDCLQKINREDKEFSGREECSESNKQAPTEEKREEPKNDDPDSRSLVLRKIRPTAILARAALDHAPFFLPNDAGNPTIREVWPFLDMFSETPTLPVVAWLAYWHRVGVLQGIAEPSFPLSAWISKQRKQCLSGSGIPPNRSSLPSKEAVFRNSFKESLEHVFCHEGTRYLDYYGPPQTLRIESYSDVYDGKVADLNGKVIFIGKSNRLFSPGKTDYFQTPYTDTRSGKMAGVEIMATQFANLLEGRFIASPIPPAIIFVVYGLVVGLVLTCFSGLFGMAASVALSGAYAGLTVWCFRQNGLWLPVVVPLLIQLPVSWIIYLLLSRLDLLAERKRIFDFIRQVFPQWVSFLPVTPGEWYPEQSTEQRGSGRDVFGLCLATDIEEYTTIATNYSPHQMWDLLEAYYQVLGRPVSSNKGIVANVQGDAMMALWVDLPVDKERYLACLAALEIQIAVERFNEKSGFDDLLTRIGLHEGDFVLASGNAGGFKFFNPFGDTVNTASRIEGANRYLGTRILASSAIVTGLSEIICRPVGVFRLKGRAEPLELAEIVGLKPVIKASQIDLIQQFAIGLHAFQQGRWADAETIFKTLLENYGDGPSRFYWAYMDSYPGSPPIGWDGAVTLPGK